MGKKTTKVKEKNSWDKFTNQLLTPLEVITGSFNNGNKTILQKVFPTSVAEVAVINV